MSKIKNSGLDQYGTEPFEQQQFGTAGVEGVNETAWSQLTTASTNETADIMRRPVWLKSVITEKSCERASFWLFDRSWRVGVFTPANTFDSLKVDKLPNLWYFSYENS